MKKKTGKKHARHESDSDSDSDVEERRVRFNEDEADEWRKYKSGKTKVDVKVRVQKPPAKRAKVMRPSAEPKPMTGMPPRADAIIGRTPPPRGMRAGGELGGIRFLRMWHVRRIRR